MSTVTQTGEKLREKGMDVRHRLDERVQQTRDRVQVVLQRHPIESVLIAGGSGVLLGFVLGFLVRRRAD